MYSPEGNRVRRRYETPYITDSNAHLAWRIMFCAIFSNRLTRVAIVVKLVKGQSSEKRCSLCLTPSSPGSLSWNGNTLCSGSRDHSIFQWDHRACQDKPIKKYLGHSQEVCGLHWSHDRQLLASGGNDNKVSSIYLSAPMPAMVLFWRLKWPLTCIYCTGPHLHFRLWDKTIRHENLLLFFILLLCP